MVAMGRVPGLTITALGLDWCATEGDTCVRPVISYDRTSRHVAKVRGLSRFLSGWLRRGKSDVRVPACLTRSHGTDEGTGRSLARLGRPDKTRQIKIRQANTKRTNAMQGNAAASRRPSQRPRGPAAPQAKTPPSSA